MKITKKLLSILLAAALIVGSVAVAAYAETPVLTYEGSVLNYTMSTDKTVDGVTNVKIGETVKVYVYMQSNFYLGTAGGEFVLWSSGIFDALGSKYTVSDPLSRYTMAAVNNPAATAAYPTGYAAADYVGVQFIRAHNASNTVPYICSEPTLVYTLELTVKNDESLIGKTATIGMPDGAVKSATNSGRKGLISQSVNNSSTALGSGTDVKAYPETTTVQTLTLNIIAAKEFCDYTALQTTYDACDELAKADEFYNAAKLATYKTALAAAKALLDVKTSAPLEKTTENEAAIADAKTNLQSAFDALAPEYVSLTALNSAIAASTTPAKAEEFYDADAYATWEDALTDAQSAVIAYTDKANTTANQNAVAAAATALTAAFAALVPQYVSLDALNSAIADCTTPAKAEEFYDAGDYADWEDALTDAQNAVAAYTDKANTTANQSAVSSAASTLRSAFAALTPQYVSLAALQTAIDNCDTPAYAEEYYVAGDYADWEDALTDAQNAVTAYTDKANTTANQNAVAAAASALTTAFAALVPHFVDLTALNKAVNDCATPDKAEEYYVEGDYADWEDALTDAQNAVTAYNGKADTAANRAAVAAAASALTDAFAALVPHYVSLSALNSAITNCTTPAKAEEFYDAGDYADWEDALTDAQNAVAAYTGKADTTANKDAVAAATKNLTDAFAALVPQYVSLSALNAAIDGKDTLDYDEKYYDAAAYSDWEDALLDAQNAVTAYTDKADTEANRNAVAAVVSALTDAYAALIPHFVSYTNIENAIMNFSTPVLTQGNYTVESWNRWVAAKAAVERLNTNKPSVPAAASDAAAQAELNNAAIELENAFNALEVVSTHITAVTTDVAHYQLGQIIEFHFTLDVTGANKVQIVRSNGTTATYNRNHSAVSSIVDNGNGTETWTIAISIITDEGVYGAKAKTTAWDGGVFNFNVKTSLGDDSTVKSAALIVNGTAATAITTKDTGAITVVTGKDTKRIRLVAANGATMTISRPASINEDGTKVWTIGRTFGAGSYSYTVWTANSTNKLAASDSKIEFTVTKFVVTPSTGNAADAVISASVRKTRILSGTNQFFNVVTDKNATAVRLIDNNGLVAVTVRTGAAAEGDTLVWNFSKYYSYDADFSYKVEALYGTTWMTSDKTVSFTVAY